MRLSSIFPSETHSIFFFDRCTTEALPQGLMNSTVMYKGKSKFTDKKSMEHTACINKSV